VIAKNITVGGGEVASPLVREKGGSEKIRKKGSRGSRYEHTVQGNAKRNTGARRETDEGKTKFVSADLRIGYVF